MIKDVTNTINSVTKTGLLLDAELIPKIDICPATMPLQNVGVKALRPYQIKY